VVFELVLIDGSANFCGLGRKMVVSIGELTTLQTRALSLTIRIASILKTCWEIVGTGLRI
jgi:hypothetical protein